MPTNLSSGLRKTSVVNNYPFAHSGSIPAGTYTSVIDAIEETVTKAGAKAIDVSYSLTNSRGQRYTMRLRVPEKTSLYDDFADAMIAAGATEDSPLDALVGIREEVTISYNDHDFAQFSSRKPVDIPSKACRDNEEFDDFLDDEEEM